MQEPHDIEAEKDALGWSKLLATWRLCDNAACGRARICRGQGQACLKAKAPLLPERVREWAVAMVWHKQEQFTFEESLDNLEASGHGQAMRDWYEEGLCGEEIEAAQ